jgi:exopolyphosphatase/guanosine-5'-triphosphate,3'-diphosphate pyrophosphatase
MPFSKPPPPDMNAFPLRVGCVDMGSNAIRFIAAEFTDDATMVRLDQHRSPVRLGHGVYLSGRLNPAAMDGAVEAMVDFRRRLDALGITKFRAVATSAVRESRNGGDLVDRIRDEAGMELEAISGSEEARLVHLAVSRRVPLVNGQFLLADLGGGSVEVSLVDETGILWSESHTMGSVRLLEELTESGADPGRFRRLLSEYISVLKIPQAASQGEIAGYVATGGNIETLAKLGGSTDDEGVTTLPVPVLREVIEKLAGMSFHQRVEELGLREDRADVVLPAALVYERLADLIGIDEIIVPHVGIKEGVLFDLVDGTVRHQDHELRQAREVVAGATVIGRKYLFDEPHARHIAELSVSLFDQMRALHGLGADERRILLAAGMLHDIGQFVSYKGHHKHTLYLVSHSELPSFSQKQMMLVANVARYHRKGHPAPHHPNFANLPPVDQERVLKLAAILRLADSLDREHVQRVTGVRVKISEDELTLSLSGSSGVILEGWGLKKKTQLFTKVYGLKVRVRMVRSHRQRRATESRAV